MFNLPTRLTSYRGGMNRILWAFLLSFVINIPSSFETGINTRRDTLCSSGTTYTTPNGLEFDVYCDIMVGGSYNTTLAPTSTTSGIASDLQECMELCSIKQPFCSAVNYNYNTSTCYYANIDYTIPTSLSSLDPDIHSAIVVPDLLVANDTSCPYDNSTLITALNGAEFSVDCGTTISGGDIKAASYTYPYHADSLDECVGYCSVAQPLCYAVEWNADMLFGWANCYLKNPAPSLDRYASDKTVGVIAHSVTLNVSNMAPLDRTCPLSTTYKTTRGDSFMLECDSWVSLGANGTSLHSDSLLSCMESCTTTNDSCSAVIFDYTMDGGFNNCYFQTSRGVFQSSGDTHAAYISIYSNGTTTSAPSSTTSSPSSTTKSSTLYKKSLSWVSGPIIGGVAAIGLLVLGWWCWNKRQGRKDDKATLTSVEDGMYLNLSNRARNEGVPELPNSQLVMQHELSGRGQYQRWPHELL